MNEKTLPYQTLQLESHQRVKHLGYQSCKIDGTILKMDQGKLQTNGPENKIMTIHKILHPRDDINRLYVSRNEGKKELASIKKSVDTSIWRFEDNMKKNKERLYYSDYKQHRLH